VVVENAHPAIVDPELFEAVQRKMKERRRPAKRPRCNEYILSGLLICGITGGQFYGRRTSYGNQFRYYTIRKPKDNQFASCYSIRKDHIEEFVLGKIVDVINQPELRDRIRKAVEKRLKRRKKKVPDTKKLEKRLSELNQKIECATERILLVDADALEHANRVLTDLLNQRRRVVAELEQFNTDPEIDLEAHVAAVMEQLADLKETIHLADPATLKPALRATIESITLYWGPGGARKWRLERGVIRFRESLLVALPCTRRPSLILFPHAIPFSPQLIRPCPHRGLIRVTFADELQPVSNRDVV
jgi:site-specific DNA recombinase